MRLIVIREPIITLLLLLPLMLTTASLPICLSFSMTISLCLPAQSLSHCQSACASLCLSLLVLVNLLPAFVVCLAVFPCSFACVLFNHYLISTEILNSLHVCLTQTMLARRDKDYGSLLLESACPVCCHSVCVPVLPVALCIIRLLFTTPACESAFGFRHSHNN